MADKNYVQDVELDEDEMIDFEEAHDPKNAEAQSVDSVAKADDSIKPAPKRRGDKTGGDKVQKATPGDPDKHTATIRDAGAQPKESYDFSDDLEALISEEATLSEGFKGKAAIIFEAAIKSHLSEEIDRLEEAYATELNEEKEAFKADLVEKVDGYLNYVVETWMEENKLAIQNGLRTEIAENFMGKLKDLFVESYVEVPESKVDLVDELAEQVEELEEKFNAATEIAIELSEKLEGYQRAAIIREHSRDLAETQFEKLNTLVEDIDFEDEETFAAKVKTIKEAYFKTKTNQVEDIAEDVDDSESTDLNENVSTSMAQYLSAIRKSSK